MPWKTSGRLIGLGVCVALLLGLFTAARATAQTVTSVRTLPGDHYNPGETLSVYDVRL